ncbi:unnamed protein product [Parnassius mnemosyne]|uniref:Uncharacterized protein n=1 Tax=Parnassius mnemosyne TaxID=213953 RepID=A0AAV1L0F6_9NEOP
MGSSGEKQKKPPWVGCKERPHSVPIRRPVMPNTAADCRTQPRGEREWQHTLDQTMIRRAERGIDGNLIYVRVRGQQNVQQGSPSADSSYNKSCSVALPLLNYYEFKISVDVQRCHNLK